MLEDGRMLGANLAGMLTRCYMRAPIDSPLPLGAC
jgi:hypothetical protein